MKIALVQTKDEGSFDKNVEKCLLYAELAGRLKIDILCFPEMQFSFFFPRFCDRRQVFQRAEGIPGSVVDLFQEKAKSFGMVIVLSLMECLANEFYNSAPVINSDGKLLGISRMVHIPQVDGYFGQSYFSSGCGDFLVYHTDKGRLGILVSYDRHFPEASRALALHDAEIVLIPGFITGNQDLSVYRAGLQAMAYQNGYFVGMCNRVGREKDMDFSGRSLLVNPEGEILVEGTAKEGFVVGEIDLDQVKIERARSPYLELRRPYEYCRIIRQN